jgi:hypothetical protein
MNSGTNEMEFYLGNERSEGYTKLYVLEGVVRWWLDGGTRYKCGEFPMSATR